APPASTLPLSLVYGSTAPVYVAASFLWLYQDLFSTQVASTAALEVHFAEGFLDPSRTGLAAVNEAYSLFNPNWTHFGAVERDAEVTLTFRFGDGGILEFHQVVAPGTLFRFVPPTSSEVID